MNFPEAFVWMLLTDGDSRLKHLSNPADLQKIGGGGRVEWFLAIPIPGVILSPASAVLVAMADWSHLVLSL